MLRSRDSFFAQSSMNQQSYFPNPGYQQMPQYQTGPYQASGANNYFYSGPTPNPTPTISQITSQAITKATIIPRISIIV